MQGYELEYRPNQVLCREGDPSSDIFYLLSGKLLVCTVQGTKVIPLATIHPGEFIGELSFFDGKTRSSHVVALEKSQVIQLPRSELSEHLPDWYLQIGRKLTKKIRLLDEVVQEANIRRFSGDQKQLSIEEQRTLLRAITQQDT